VRNAGREPFQRTFRPGMRAVRAPQQDLPCRNMDRNRIPRHRHSMTARLLTPGRWLPVPCIGTITLRTNRSGANTSIYRGQCRRPGSAQADPDRSFRREPPVCASANSVRMRPFVNSVILMACEKFPYRNDAVSARTRATSLLDCVRRTPRNGPGLRNG